MPEPDLLWKHVQDGQEAEAVLQNPVFKQVAEELQKRFATDFKGDDEVKALEARREVRVFEALLGKILRIQERGVKAAASLEELKQRDKEGLPTDANSLGGIA
ncbi:MAG: hypothetical protein ACR2RF_32300 [Geminicoccaceae bacterium]